MNIKKLVALLTEMDYAGNGNTSVEIVTNTGSIKQITKVSFSAMTGAVQIMCK